MKELVQYMKEAQENNRKSHIFNIKLYIDRKEYTYQGLVNQEEHYNIVENNLANKNEKISETSTAEIDGEETVTEKRDLRETNTSKIVSKIRSTLFLCFYQHVQ